MSTHLPRATRARRRGGRDGGHDRSYAEGGQALVVSIVFLASLLAMAAAVIDVGSWYHQRRQLQGTADAAALAGAQGLSSGTGVALAVQYGDKNGAGVASNDVTVRSIYATNDTIDVTARKAAPGVFTKLFGITSVNVRATASARAGVPAQVAGAAPIGVDEKHPLISGSGCPCFGTTTTLDLTKTGPGAFRLINLDNSHGGTPPGTLGTWIQNGYDGYMPLGWYFSDPGAKFNSSQVKAAMNAVLGKVLLFPIYREVQGNGANLQYHVVGWAGFHVTGFTGHGSSGTVDGWFVQVTWDGILSQSGSGSTDYGVRSVELVG